MSDKYYGVLKPGILEVYCGPMKSGKTRELLNRIDKLSYLPNWEFDIFKPSLDTRDSNVKSRFGSLSYECKITNESCPEDLFDLIKDNSNMVAIDEAQFFSEGIENVVESLLKKDINVIIAGLDLDFRGESFGRMNNLLAMADEVYKLSGVCDHDGCGNAATRTQRLIDGKPAPYDSKQILIGDEEEGYECRCLKHHIVPGKIEISFKDNNVLYSR